MLKWHIARVEIHPKLQKTSKGRCHSILLGAYSADLAVLLSPNGGAPSQRGVESQKYANIFALNMSKSKHEYGGLAGDQTGSAHGLCSTWNFPNQESAKSFENVQQRIHLSLLMHHCKWLIGHEGHFPQNPYLRKWEWDGMGRIFGVGRMVSNHFVGM